MMSLREAMLWVDIGDFAVMLIGHEHHVRMCETSTRSLRTFSDIFCGRMNRI
jgi:hypothetical protein